MKNEFLDKAIHGILISRNNALYYQNYYDGKHALKFAGDRFKNDYGQQLQEFADNLCKIPVTAPADRLQISGFANEKETDIRADSWEIWKRSGMPGKSNELHKDCFLFGSSYFTVWIGDDLRPRFYPQENGTCKIWKTADGQTVFGAKMYFDRAARRHKITLYFPDKIEFYETISEYKTEQPPAKSSAFRQDANRETVANPTGIIPLFELSRADGSVLDDVIPLNNALNKTVADLLIGSEAASRRQRWSTGTSYLPDAETGKPIIPFDNDDLFVSSSKEGAKFGTFDAPTLEGFIAVANYFRNEISTVSGVPPYYFFMLTGEIPSGVSLQRIETRFINQIENAQYNFGEQYTAGMQLALMLESRSKAEQFAIETKFTPSNPQTEPERLDNALKKKELGISPEIYLADYGLTENEIALSLEYQSKQRDAAAESFGKVFDGGGVGLE